MHEYLMHGAEFGVKVVGTIYLTAFLTVREWISPLDHLLFIAIIGICGAYMLIAG